MQPLDLPPGGGDVPGGASTLPEKPTVPRPGTVCASTDSDESRMTQPVEAARPGASISALPPLPGAIQEDSQGPTADDDHPMLGDEGMPIGCLSTAGPLESAFPLQREPSASAVKGVNSQDGSDRSNGTAPPAAPEPDPTDGQSPSPPPRQAPIRQVSSEAMFSALVGDMKESPNVGHVEAWIQTIRQLFAEAYATVPVLSEELPADRKRFPTLSEAEASSLLGFLNKRLSTPRDALRNEKN
uniref:Uncharacterized protein n=1 Tax=Peronospora matthiolae TaxID=2874970 RepID=A0AAV1V5D7_9STRA